MYEHKTYVEARRRFPREGRTLQTAHGPEKVIAVDVLQERVTLRDEDGNRRVVSLEELKSQVGGGAATPQRGDD
jgi:cell fate regulator YaaT (PSP1 superfamily)